MKLIDKDALVAEIKKCYNECLKRAKITDSGYWNAKADAYRNVWVILNDTLEVKEVDLKEEIDKIWKPRFSLGWDDKSLLSISYKGFEVIAKHFFELGLNKDSYKQGYADAIEKACEWLERNFNMPHDFKCHFHKAMEGGE